MLITIIGMPATGKTTFGACLAKELGYHFRDLDHDISLQQNMSIAQIFSTKGEPFFRALEHKILQQHLDSQNLVLALGGGTPCFQNNMQAILANSLCIYLETDLGQIARRLSHPKEKKTRPLFDNLSENQILERLETLYHQRIEYYKQAHFTLRKNI